ncbi:MAG TPA: hypothetical protein VF329_04875 [Gammaproteobacteria bacterium]
MKLLAASLLPLMVVGCAGAPTTSDTGPADRCEVTDCFFERDVRSFEVVDSDTVVVYVGSQRCPFVVELEGIACDVAIAPQIHFMQAALGRFDRVAPVRSAQICSTTTGLYLYAGIIDPSALFDRESIDPITGRRRGLGGFPSDDAGFDGAIQVDPTSRDICRVDDIRSVNDDQLIELFVEEGVAAPPPPVGSGELEVPEQPEEAGAAPGGAAAPPTQDGGREEAEQPSSAPAEGSRSEPAAED